MLKSLFDPSTIYQKRTQRCLENARLAALEHETAAEFHAALGEMYRERAARLERELAGPATPAPNVIIDTSMHPRVSALRRNESRGQPFLEEGSAAAS